MSVLIDASLSVKSCVVLNDRTTSETEQRGERWRASAPSSWEFPSARAGDRRSWSSERRCDEARADGSKWERITECDTRAGGRWVVAPSIKPWLPCLLISLLQCWYDIKTTTKTRWHRDSGWRYANNPLPRLTEPWLQLDPRWVFSHPAEK